MKFIFVFETKLKEQLLSAGYTLLTESGKVSIFANDKLNFSFSEVEKSKYLFSDIMLF